MYIIFVTLSFPSDGYSEINGKMEENNKRVSIILYLRHYYNKSISPRNES